MVPRAAAAARRGVTLVEMSVTILVLGMLVGALVMMVTSGERVSGGVKERMDQTNSATIAMERMSRNLRTAVLQSQLTTACILSVHRLGVPRRLPISVQFYADVDNPKNTVGPSRVTYTVAGGSLVGDRAEAGLADSGRGRLPLLHERHRRLRVRSTILATGVQTAPACSPTTRRRRPPRRWPWGPAAC